MNPREIANKQKEENFNEFKEWLYKQPDDKMVDMQQCHNYEKADGFCGCLLVQFVESLRPDLKVSCGYGHIRFINKKEDYLMEMPAYLNRLFAADCFEFYSMKAPMKTFKEMLRRAERGKD